MGPEFKPGDLVSLKSGGPTMTVEDVNKEIGGPETADCIWFDKNEARRARFRLNSLVKASMW